MITAAQAALRQADQEWRASPRRPPFAGVGRLRKVALLGGAVSTLRYAPWTDPTWELWAHASCRRDCKRPPDLLWDLHPKALWSDPTKKKWDPGYGEWLKSNVVPIMMQQHYKDVPASIKFPFEQIITEWHEWPYFTNHVAWMIALALSEGVTHLSVFGCHYDSHSEYFPQRGSAEFWLGVAIGRGVHVGIPPTCDLLQNPLLLYGYESHPDGVRDPSYSVTVKRNETVKVKTPDGEKALTIVRDDAAPRPPLRDLGKPVDWAHSGLTVHR